MGFGIFGKLPAKRDFIAFGIPRAVLGPFEEWLQSSMAASQSDLARDWRQNYLVSPVWSFWIGRCIFGRPVAGSLIPSVDKVGRYFPLTILYICDTDETVQPFLPEQADGWYQSVEDRLLEILEVDQEISPQELLVSLDDPALQHTSLEHKELDLKAGMCFLEDKGRSVDELMGQVMKFENHLAAEYRSYWWTSSTEDRGPMFHACQGMPEPHDFSVFVAPSVYLNAR